MTTGTTSDFALSRDEVIEMAFQKIGISTNSTLTTRAVKVLNLIIREEDLKGTQAAKNLWAFSENALFLAADSHVYTTTQGLSSTILDLNTVFYRNTTGEDSDVDVYSTEQYESIQDKDEKGDVQAVYLKDNVAIASKILYVWPTPDTVGTTSEVTGTDALNYQCIMGHTSATDNRPITGQNWRLYWQQSGSSGSAWAASTSYTNGELLRYVYKRPLYDFDLSTDNPDMPQGWTRYLMYRLAHDLAPEFKISIEDRAWLKREYLEAYAMIFPSMQPVTTSIHNKGLFF